MELNPRNQKTLEVYNAVHGARLSGDGFDELLIENLGIIHGLVTDHERRRKVNA